MNQQQCLIGLKMNESLQRLLLILSRIDTKKYERDFQEGKIEHVPLESIHFGIIDLKAFPHVMQGIKPYQKPESTIQEMLGLLSSRDEIIYSQGGCKLTKHGLLYKHLTEKLARTS